VGGAAGRPAPPAEELDLERDQRAPLREAGNATPGPAYVNDFLLLLSASG
jgi:hypothetical protein